MKRIFVDISAEHYDRMLAQIIEGSRLYSLLKNGVIIHDRQTGVPRSVVKILCEASDGEMLIDATKTFCPEATAEIEKSITLFQWRS